MNAGMYQQNDEFQLGHSERGGHFLSEKHDMGAVLQAKIAEQGGFVNCHAHFDKSFYVTEETLEKSMYSMEEKWRMSDAFKRSLSQEDVEARIRLCLDRMCAQGVTATASFIDAYGAVGHTAIDAARVVQEVYRSRITLYTITQPLGGLVEAIPQKLYEEITAKADIAGGLPSIDRPYDDVHFDALFSIARNLNKPLHVHIDQENNPAERDLEKLITYTKKYGYEGRVAAVHAISLAAQSEAYQDEIARQLKDLGISVIVCPSAALSMRQRSDMSGPLHNSIAPVPLLIAHGVTVGLGVDNIADYYQPFVSGDLWTEVRMLQEACRYYDLDALSAIATQNGRRILSMK